MRNPITPNGLVALKRELKRLKSTRPELSKAIEVARAHGDISENAEYDAAKEKSGMTEARIRDLEQKLALADVIDPRNISSHDRVVFGLTAKIQDMDNDEERLITIVGSEESDVHNNRISFESPMGKALIGKRIGDEAKVELPGGVRQYEVTEIYCDYEPRVEEVDASE